MPTQDIFFNQLTNVIFDDAIAGEVGVTEVIFNGETIFTDENPILGVDETDPVTVGTGLILPTYRFSLDWSNENLFNKTIAATVIVRVYDSNGDSISENAITYSETINLNSQPSGTIVFSGFFGSLLNEQETGAYIKIAAGTSAELSNLQVLSPIA